MLVLDSSFLIAFHNERDFYHARALGIMDRAMAGEWGPMLLPEYVFLEVVTVVRLRRNLATAVRVGEALLKSRELEFLPCSEVFLRAFETFRGEPRRKLSFVDAAVAAIARIHPPGAVATFDSGFKGLEGVVLVN
jgi:predicted nucleic acid-binding protein